MADVLDQSEVDALLSAVAEAPQVVERPQATIFTRRNIDPSTLEIKGYDFKRPERVSKDQMRSLQTVHEAFARNFGASLSGFLRTIVEVRVATCEQMTYSEFISGLPNPTSFNLLKADALEGQMCLEISPLIIYPIIDRLLGGNSQDLFIPQRPMTLIETRLISNVTTRGLTALSEAWAGVKELAFSIAASESNPQLVQIVPPNEVVVVIGFEMKMHNRAGTMNLCIPYNVIEPVVEDLSSQNWFAASKNQRSDESAAQIAGTLTRASLEVTGVLAETTISLADLMAMTPGDILTTEKLAASPIVLAIEGEKKYLVNVGQYRGNRALRVLRAISPDDRV
jgi:flagellar motor switch protein FliM